MAHPAFWNEVFVLRVTLEDIEPRVWRTLRVPAAYPLASLHQVLQVAFGWTNSHLHDFEVGDVRFGMQDVDDELLFVDERWAPLGAVAAAGTVFNYRYDFGDGWEHEVFVENVEAGGETWDLTVSCLAGARACPPEDCGGASGFARTLEVLADPSHEEHREMRTWVGRKYDPESFDLAGVNRKLTVLGKRLEREFRRSSRARWQR